MFSKHKLYKIIKVLFIVVLILNNFRGLDSVFAIDGEMSDDTESSEDIDLQGMFDIIGNVEYNGKKSLHLGNQTGQKYIDVKLASKFKVNMQKSFKFKGKMTSTGSNPDGFAIGLIEPSSKSAFLNSTNTGGEFYIYTCYKPLSIKRAIVYEVDMYSNHIGTSHLYSLDYMLPYNREYNPHVMLASVEDGVSSAYNNPQTFAHNSNKDEREYVMEYNKDDDILKIGWGSMIMEYANAKEFLGDEAQIFISGVINTYSYSFVGYTGGMTLDFQVDSFKYTDVESKSSVDYYIKREEDLVAYDKDNIDTFPQSGETVLVRHTIHNEINTPKDESATANIATSKMGTTATSPTNLKMYTGSPSAPVEIDLDETDIFNGAVDEDGLYKQATIPLLKEKGSTYIEYEYTIPTDKKYEKIEDSIVFGQKGMTQYTYSNTAKVANSPYLTGMNTTIAKPLDTGIMSASEIKSNITGKLFDGSDYTDLSTTDVEHMNFSYTVDNSTTKTIDKAKEGRYRIDYSAKDIRTNLTETGFRYLWITDKKTEINSKEAMAAKDFTMMIDEVKPESLEQLIIQRSGIEAYTNEGTRLPIEDITITHSIKPRAGKYAVTFTTPEQTSTTIDVNCSVYEYSKVDPITNETMYANDFTIDETMTSTVDNALLLSLSSVKAIDNNGNEVLVKVKENTVVNKTQGRYPVTFVTEVGSSITIHGQVTKKYTEDNGERLMANDFYISAKDAYRKEEKQILTLSKAEAIDLTTLNKLDG